MMDDITRKRVENEPDNKNITPEQLLELALNDIRKGKVKPNRVIIILAELDERGMTRDIVPYRCGCTRIEEAGIMALRMHVHCKNWTE